MVKKVELNKRLKMIRRLFKNKENLLIIIYVVVILLGIFIWAKVYSWQNEIELEERLNSFAQIDNVNYSFDEFYKAVNIEGQSEVSQAILNATSLYINGNDIHSIDLHVLDCFKKLNSLEIVNSEIYNTNVINDLESLELLTLEDVETKEAFSIDNENIKSLSFENCTFEINYIDTPSLELLSLINMEITESLLDRISSLDAVTSLNINKSTIDSLEVLAPLKNITDLHMNRTKVVNEDYDKLIMFDNLNAVYLSDNIDRRVLDFMEDNFKDGDTQTITYFVSKKNNLELR